MKLSRLEQLVKRLYFSSADVGSLFELAPASAHLLCSRYTAKNVFIRLKKDCYTLSQRWNSLQGKDIFRLANILQVPSYISLMSALSFFQVTTQMQQNYIESVALKRSVTFHIKETDFKFYKIAPAFYGDFVRQDEFFIATKEKAFLDCAYLTSFGKYRFDVASIDIDKLDKKKIKQGLKPYPKKTQMLVERLCKI
ncbi:MAG: hypothetical protein HY209_06365 [Candidatus Omnitrophica bacterium]|nr:hypothetical protein [Candidatus Omnitrophota bacterium]